jgi:hypothetical protein
MNSSYSGFPANSIWIFLNPAAEFFYSFSMLDLTVSVNHGFLVIVKVKVPWLPYVPTDISKYIIYDPSHEL